MLLIKALSFCALLTVCLANMVRHAQHQEYRIVDSLRVAKSELAHLILDLFERRDVASLSLVLQRSHLNSQSLSSEIKELIGSKFLIEDREYSFMDLIESDKHSIVLRDLLRSHLPPKASSSAVKTLVESKYKIRDKELSFMDLLESEGHLFLVLAKWQRTFPLIDELVFSIGSKAKRSQSPNQLAIFELILRFPRIHKHLPVLFSKNEAIETFKLLVDYAIGIDVDLESRKILSEKNSTNFFKSLLGSSSIRFEWESFNSYLKLLAYSQAEIEDCARMMFEDKMLYFTEVKFHVEQLVPLVEKAGSLLLAFIQYPHEPSVDRLSKLILHCSNNLLNDESFAAFKRIRRAKFLTHCRHLKQIPIPAVKVLFKYYICEFKKVKASDIQAIIYLTPEQRLSLKSWQHDAMDSFNNYHDGLSDPEITDRIILFDALLKLGVDMRNEKFYILAKTIVPYIVDPDLEPQSFKTKIESHELVGLTILPFNLGKFPSSGTVHFKEFACKVSGPHDIITRGNFYCEYDDKSFTYFFGRFLSFKLSLEKNLDRLLWEGDWSPSGSKMFFNNLYNALRNMPYNLDSIIGKLELLDQDALKRLSPESNFNRWAKRLIDYIERKRDKDGSFVF